MNTIDLLSNLQQKDGIPLAGVGSSGMVSSSASGTKMGTFSSATTFFATSGTLKILF